ALLSGAWRHALASAGATVPLSTSAGVALRAGAVSRLLPGGGAAAGVFAVQRLRRGGVGDGAAVTGVALANATLLVTLAVSVAVVGLRGRAPTVGAPWLVPTAAAAALLAAVAALRSARLRGALHRVADRLRGRRGADVWVAALDSLAATRPRRRDLLGTVACAVGAWACELGALAAAVAAVADPLPLGAVALGLGAAHAAAAVPHTPGGVGVVEIAMTAALAAAGLDTAVALGAVLAYRLVGFWLPVTVGAGLLGSDWLRRAAAA
ncbi:MAG TPA: lysylphosphatidylglycerol synthase domain-containing protein, partial [Egibacteraceae bacterium]